MGKKVKSDNNDKQRIVTDRFRASYPHVFKPQAIKGGEPKYSITMLFKKDQDLSAIKAAMRAAKIAEFGANKANWPDDLESPVVDGDSPKHADKEGYKGHWAIKASSNADSKPGVVDKDGEAILDASEFYPGCFARASIFARVWEFGDKQGVHFILDHVQKLGEGKKFGGKKSAAEAFGSTPINDDDLDDEDGDEDGDEDEGFL